MSRKLENWLKSYQDFARDAYCPESFHLWTGLSILAGALERKVWLPNRYVTFYPNLFIFLVTYPGVGKSTAIRRGVNFLERLRAEINPEFKIIDNQTTEPAFVESMRTRQEMRVSETRMVFHSSGYFHADEASASALQNTHGTFTSTVTAFYDCPKVFRKATKLDGAIEIHNICFNLLSGATFNYLSTLVDENSVMGGFASRLIYVVNRDRIVRESKWVEGEEIDHPMIEPLFEDLINIHGLQGRFTPTKGFKDAWEKFQPESDRSLIALNSDRLESLAARKSLHTTKIAMLLSVSEGNSLVVDTKHWDRAMELVEEVSKDNAFILSQGVIADKQNQLGTTQMIGQILKKRKGKMNLNTLRQMTLMSGHGFDVIARTIDFMASAGTIKLGADGSVELLVDPDRYL